MTIPFQVIYPDEIKISAARAHSLITTYGERQRTGLIRLAYSPEKEIYLLFQRGLFLNGYLVDHTRAERIQDWQDTLNQSGEAYARVVPLSSSAVEMCKLAIESTAGNPVTISVPDLRASLDNEWVHTATPKLLHLGWSRAEGLIFFQGMELDAHSLFFSSNRLVDESGIASAFSLWSESQVALTAYEAQPNLPAWQEYNLRRAFAEICNRALSRYEAITGRVIVDSIVRSLILYASRHSKEINITSRRVTIRELFSTPQGAADLYRILTGMMLDQINQIIGSKLSYSIISDITAGLRLEEFQVAQAYSILPPELFSRRSPL